MNRRNFLIGAGAALLTRPASAASSSLVTRPNGEWDGKTFHWRRIGVDPFGMEGNKKPLQVALNLFGISAEDQRLILKSIEVSKGVYTTPDEIGNIAAGHRYHAMVSGGIRSTHPWVTTNVVPHPDAGWSSTKVDVWRVQVQGGEVILGRPHGCDNWLLLRADNALYSCRCRPDLGDACS